MSGLGTALSALVNGFAGGRDVRNKWEDRKDDKKRQEWLDQILKERESRDAEAHELQMTTGGLLNDGRRRDLQAWDRNWGDSTRTRTAMEEADAAAAAGMSPAGPVPALGAAPPPVAEAAPIRGGLAFPEMPRESGGAPRAALRYSTSDQTAAPVRAEAAGEAQAREAPPAQDTMIAPPVGGEAPKGALSFGATATVGGEQAGAPVLGATPGAPALFEPAPDGKVYAARPPRNAEEQAQIQQAAREKRLAVRPDRAERQAQVDAIATGADKTPFQRDMGAAVDRNRALKSQFAEQVLNFPADVADVVNAPLRRASEYFTGRDVLGAAPRVDLNRDGRETSVVSPLFDLVRPPQQTPESAARALEAETRKPDTPAKAATPAKGGGDQAVVQGAVETMNAIGDDPAMKAAANATPMSALGAKPGQPVSEARRKTAAKTYMQSYRENGAPIVMRELMRQGRFDEAQKFDAFIRSAEAQEGMEKWGEGMFAALSGDADGVFDFLADAYNTPGYFDDGYQVVKKESDLIRDRAGNPVGIKLTLQHTATGEKITQQGNVQDIMMHFLWKLSPQEAFKAHSERQAALSKALVEAQAKRDDQAAKMIADQLGWDNRAALETMKASGGFDGKLTMTWPEAQNVAMGASPYDDLPQDDVPVARRPQ